MYIHVLIDANSECSNNGDGTCILMYLLMLTQECTNNGDGPYIFMY